MVDTTEEKQILAELLAEIEGFVADDSFEQRQKIQQERFEKIVEPTLTEAQKEVMKQPMRFPDSNVRTLVSPKEVKKMKEQDDKDGLTTVTIPPKMSGCTKLLLFVVLPISAPLLLMVTAMALVDFFHIYLDFLRPLWIQLPEAPLYGLGFAIPAGLVAAYISCRLSQRELRKSN